MQAQGWARYRFLRGWPWLLAGLLLHGGGGAWGAEYQFSPLLPGGRDTAAALTGRGIADIAIKTDCPPPARPNLPPPPCTYSAVNARGVQIRGFGETPTGLVGKGRFDRITYALLSQGGGMQGAPKYFIMDQTGRSTPFADPHVDPIVAAVSRDRELVAVLEDGLVVKDAQGQELRRAALPFGKVRSAAVGVNPEGPIAVVAVVDADHIFVSDTHAWLELDTRLAVHGDRRGILAVYPPSDHTALVAIYRFVNSYNKGLVFAQADFKKSQTVGGHLFNSEDRNVGFDPQLYMEGGTVIVGATDATHRQGVHFEFPLAEADHIADRAPGHIQGFEQEASYAIVLGAGLSQVHWRSDSRIDVGGSTRAHVDYDISSSLFRSYQFEGRILSTRLAVSYAEQEAQRSGQEGSRILTTLFDINDLFAPSWDLRLAREQGRLEGVARFHDDGRAPFSTESTQETVFRNTYTRQSALVLFERGWFAGLEQTQSTLPSAVGFSDSGGKLLYTAYDPNVSVRTIEIVGGYERLAYARSYESTYRGLNYAFKAGLGQSNISVASGVANKARDLTGKSKPAALSPGVYELAGDLGYIVQDRFKPLRGTGFTLAAGVRFTYTDYSANKAAPETDEEKQQAKKDKDKLFLKFHRIDTVYGPYVLFNLLF